MRHVRILRGVSRRPGTAGIALALICAIGAPCAPRAQADFGFHEASASFLEEDGTPATLAGFHPFAWTTTFTLNSHTAPPDTEVPDQDLKDLRIQLPPGLIGTPALLPHCSHAEFSAEACALATEVGSVELATSEAESAGEQFPIYNLAPNPGAAAELGFIALKKLPVAIKVTVNPDPPYNLTASLANVSQAASFFGAVLTISGQPEGRPFLTMPRRCAGSLAQSLEADSWQQPGVWTQPFPAQPFDQAVPPQPAVLSGCAGLAFRPTLSAQPTSNSAAGPTGLDIDIDAPLEGLTSASEPAEADIHRAVLALPAGMSVNAAVAAGLAGCTPADYRRETLDSSAGSGCPEASRLGTARVESPLLEGPVNGSIFLAAPEDNPFDSLLALYVVFKDPGRGILIKQAVEVQADPASGRLTAAIADIPELPFSHLELQIRSGPRAPLLNPPGCAGQAIDYQLTPSSGAAPLNGEAAFRSEQNCAAPGFAPTLSAGTTNKLAGASSPFVFDLGQGEGEQNLSRLSLTLPPGLSADLTAVTPCSQALVATGACPTASRIGSAHLLAGAGATPVQIPQPGDAPSPVFLAGPYRGAPLSLLIVVAAQAGPFDLGSARPRAAIEIDPRSAQATVRLDPLPQILKGVPLAYRDLALEIDHPDFTRNPTSCEPAQVTSSIASIQGATASPSVYFQAGGCARLAFKPRLSLRLSGSTRRGAHPALHTVLTARRGEADIAKVAATLPGAELLDNSHIKAVCTPAAYAVSRCPAGSRVGSAKAWTPLLERPLSGAIYLRAGKHKLPDLVASLDGQVHLDLAAHVDSTHGRLRIGFPAIPDVPLSKVALTLLGGRRGLLVNSGGVCASSSRAKVNFGAHDGKARALAPVVHSNCQ